MADRTLVITSVPPWPLHRNGGAQRTALLVRALRDLGGEVDLVAVLPDVGEPLPPREVMAAAGLRDAVLVPNDLPPEGRSRLPGPAGGLANVLRLWSFRYAARPAAVGRVADLLPGYGRVVVRYLQTALLCGLDAAPPDVRSRVEVDLDDVDWLTLRSRFAADPWPGIGGRLAMRLVLRQVRRRCLSALENLSPRYVASDEDAAELAREGVAARVLPNVPFFEEGQGPPAPLDPSGPASRRVLFVGDLKFPPNRDGLERLLEKSWPAVRSGTPGATLRVVGRGVDEESRARWSAHAGVDVLGFAEDLRAEYAAAAATVAPVWYGGGDQDQGRRERGPGPGLRGGDAGDARLQRPGRPGRGRGRRRRGGLGGAGPAAGRRRVPRRPGARRPRGDGGTLRPRRHPRGPGWPNGPSLPIAGTMRLMARRPDDANQRRPLRVTFVLPFAALEGGVRVVVGYAKRLADRGHDVRVVSPSAMDWPLSWRIKRRVREALKLNFARPYGPSHLAEIGPLHRRVPGPGPVRARHVPDADVIVATWWKTAEWVADMPAAKGRKVHLIQHDERVFVDDDEDRRRRVAEATWRTPDVTRAVVADWIGEVGRIEFGTGSVVVPNAVDLSLFDAPPRGRNAAPTVGFVYNRERWKGADVAIAAYEKARQSVPDLRLRCFGAHAEIPEFPLPSGATLEVAPPQRRIAEIYRSCDAWLFASRCEGYGLPLLEAMACRTPVVATPTGAAPELLAGGGGRLVAMEDSAAMADALVDLVTGPEPAWRAASDAARATAERHDWDAAVDRFERVLRAAAEGRQAPPSSGAADAEAKGAVAA